MPRSAGQWTGFAVTMIVVLGRDLDLLVALPLGLAAGLLASVLANLPAHAVVQRIRRE